MNDTPAKPVSPLPPETESTADYPQTESGSAPSSFMRVEPGDEIPKSIGDYTILRNLGEGGMGKVYLGEDIRLGRKVAIKTMLPELAANPSARKRFIREARAAAALEHDNIVPIWQIGEAADGSPFIVMPFLQGETLESRLKREPIAPLSIILKVALEVAEGLAAAHVKGLIHRDIKPANVWLEGDPTAPQVSQQVRRCKILDFGLARSMSDKDAQLTSTGIILGTPAYMSPEQAGGGGSRPPDRPVQPRCDVVPHGDGEIALHRCEHKGRAQGSLGGQPANGSDSEPQRAAGAIGSHPAFDGEGAGGATAIADGGDGDGSENREGNAGEEDGPRGGT